MTESCHMVLTLGLGSAGLPPGAALTQGPTGPSRLNKEERFRFQTAWKSGPWSHPDLPHSSAPGTYWSSDHLRHPLPGVAQKSSLHRIHLSSPHCTAILKLAVI